MAERRVVITGMEVIAPGGHGRDAFWDLLTSGRTATRRIDFFDPAPFRSQVAAQVDFTPEPSDLTAQETARLDRAAQFALVAGRRAVSDSGIAVADGDPNRVGVTIGTAVGATMSLEADYRVVSDEGRLDLVDESKSGPHFHDAFIPSSFAAELATTIGCAGPAAVISAGCTSGIDSVGYATEVIRSGRCDVMIAGATDAPISPITLACFDAIKATTPRNDDPATASRPFDASRNGFVLGEGAAVFVLEELETAQRRGATAYGEILGYATRSNAYHMTGLRPDGAEMADAITAAMRQARVAPNEIRYVNAHGSGTRQNDRHETAAVKKSLGAHAYKTCASSIKSMIGHSLGAIGSIEIAATTLAVKNGVIPPTANLHDNDPECDLDYVPLTAREQDTPVALTVGSGFGGFQSAMLIGSMERHTS